MSTIANSTHYRQGPKASSAAGRTLVRRVADWWSNDSMSTHFSAERERQLNKLQRAGCRTS
ncbi:MAG TPA: hypothetical protein VGF46_09700 [Gaiellales bacterium]|jgi:hypothetical protein